MANPLPIKKSFAALLSFLVLFSTVGPSGFALKIPTAKAAIIDVSNLNDAGAGSLRQAIIDADSNGPGLDTITFSVSGIINLQSDLPGLINPAILDATTTVQAGPNITLNAAGRNTGLAFNGGTGIAVYGIAVTGAQTCFRANNGVTGITFGNNTVEGGVEAHGCTNRGFDIAGASNVTIVNASIGTNAANNIGVGISNNANNVTIGGTTANERVIISGNTQQGVMVNGANNVTIKGSYIGVDKNGATQANGQDGIFVDNMVNTNVVIGGNTVGERNIISGNTQSGVKTYANGVTIKGNYIGTDPTGLLARANGQGGIRLESANNTIGGNTAAEGNLIAGNSFQGIRIDGGIRNADGNNIFNNIIGQKADGSASLANNGDGIQVSGGTISNTTIKGNVISGNAQNGIFLNNNVNNSTVQANIIGLSADGSATRPNTFNGIIVGGSNNTIGLTNDAGARNFISGNSQSGILLQGSTNTVVNNCIGTDLSCNSNGALRNSQHAINIMNGGANNIIGGDAVGATNTIHPNNGQMAVSVQGNAGNNNTFSHNNFLDRGAGGQFTMVTNPANNGINPPTIGSLIRVAPNAVQIVGNSVAGYRIDIYAGGIWMTNIVVQGNGVYATEVTTLSDNFTVIATNGTGSSSGTPNIVTATPDNIAPNAPTAAPSVNPAQPGQTVTISGTGEKGTSVYNNGVDTGIDVDNFNNYAFDVTALDGANNISVTLVDRMSNVSPATAANFNAADTIAPAAPVANASTNSGEVGSDVSIFGTGEANSDVYFNGVLQGAVDGAGNYSYDITLVLGANPVDVTLKDAADNESAVTTVDPVVMGVDTTAPGAPATADIDPAIGEQGSLSTISGTGAEVGASVYIDGVDTGMDVDGLGEFSFDVALALGLNSFDLTIVDQSNNASNIVTLNATGVDTTAPAAPTATASANSGEQGSTVSISGTGEADASVLFNDVLQGVVDGLGDYSFDIILVLGENPILVTLMDAFDNVSAATAVDPVVMGVDTTPPAAPTATINTTEARVGTIVTISGTGEIGAEVYSNGATTDAFVDGFGVYTFNAILALGTNSYEVTLVDASANVSAGITVAATGTQAVSGGTPTPTPVVLGPVEEVETGNVVDEDTQTSIDVGTTPEDTTSIAGDEEVSDPEITTPEITEPVITPDEPENIVVEPVKPVKSFIQVINEVIQPIKIQQIRDTLPEKPSAKIKLTEPLLKTKVFGPSTNEYGIPDEIVQIKQKFYNLKNKNLNLDSDGDGLTDGEEILYFTDPLVTDSDGDGTDDIHEIFVTGTDPSLSDTDHDGRADNVDARPFDFDPLKENADPKEITAFIEEENIQVSLGTNDEDNDGLVDLLEFYLGTDPLSDDSDLDGYTDGDEHHQFGTDPIKSTSSSQIGGMVVANGYNNEMAPATQQFYMGQAPAGTEVTIYEIDANGGFVPLAKTESDEFGRFNALTDSLTAGTHTLVAVAGTLENPVDISAPFSVTAYNVVSKPEYQSLSLKNGAIITDRDPEIDLLAKGEHMIVIAWRSSIYSQTLIADAADQTIYAKPAENLELGDHTVTWYAVDPESNQKSEPTQVAFTITNAAFINGENQSSLWTMILGSIAVLASLTALGLYFRKGKVTR